MRLSARRRLVRLHLGSPEVSIEGILLGVWRDHYVLGRAALVGQPPLDGERAYIPRARVIFLQEISSR